MAILRLRMEITFRPSPCPVCTVGCLADIYQRNNITCFFLDKRTYHEWQKVCRSRSPSPENLG